MFAVNASKCDVLLLLLQMALLQWLGRLLLVRYYIHIHNISWNMHYI